MSRPRSFIQWTSVAKVFHFTWVAKILSTSAQFPSDLAGFLIHRHNPRPCETVSFF